MILTGSEIKKEVLRGNITLSPFNEEQINPNSYNYRLGKVLKEFIHFDGKKSHFKKIIIPKKGYVLKPKTMYLGHTYEIIGSKKYAMSLIGRSSMGRLGLFLQLSANLGHVTSSHNWTLELFAIKSIRLYPEMIIGQVTFWINMGDILEYNGVYGKFTLPQESCYKHDFNWK
jgi:dCTP deaminase